ncbi:MAG: Rrf2 family transcriptional regulator [Bifidobacteriaceae bacterium]|jgi:DNA-binding IscR family transcriptional regulator|nr:Rrf2 family transcriptional regulator [Bifidobacteriaceae bacterium]
MQSHKLSDAIHILTYIEVFGRDRAAGIDPSVPHVDLSSASIAKSVESNPGLIRRLMSTLAKAGLLDTRPGSAEPRLARPIEDISVLDVYRAIGGETRFLNIDEKTNPQCIVGGNIQQSLNDVYSRVQASAEATMASTSLATIVDDVLRREQAKTAVQA